MALVLARAIRPPACVAHQARVRYFPDQSLRGVRRLHFRGLPKDAPEARILRLQVVNKWPEYVLLSSRNVLLLQGGIPGAVRALHCWRGVLIVVLVAALGFAEGAAGLELL